MQVVKTYTVGFFKGEARYQFFRDLKKMTKRGWHVHTVNDIGQDTHQYHISQYKVVYEKEAN